MNGWAFRLQVRSHELPYSEAAPMAHEALFSCGSTDQGGPRRGLGRQTPPIERAILNGFADMLRRQIGCPVEIGNRAGDLEDAVIGSRREPQPRDRGAQ